MQKACVVNMHARETFLIIECGLGGNVCNGLFGANVGGVLVREWCNTSC
jgi:hypothetical protein